MENVGVTPGTITSHQVNLDVRPDQTDIYIIVLMSKNHHENSGLFLSLEQKQEQSLRNFLRRFNEAQLQTEDN